MPLWPGLAELHLPASLGFERAVYGKASNVRTDYRWLASTPGMRDRLPELQPFIKAGPVDTSGRAPLWRALGDGEYLAIGCRPSRARDAAGRLTLIERDVLLWKAPEGVHAVIGVAVFGPLLAELSDDVWWQERKLTAWSDPDFVLELDGSRCAPRVPVDPEQLRGRLEAGLESLTRLGSDQLARAVEGVRGEASSTPVVLSGLDEPLSAEELAALLLMARPEVAERTSIAGWLFTRRATAYDLVGWNLVGCQRAGTLLRAQSHRLAASLAAIRLADSVLAQPQVQFPQDDEDELGEHDDLTEEAGLDLDELLQPEVKVERLADLVQRGRELPELSSLLDEVDEDIGFLVDFALGPKTWLDSGDRRELALVPERQRPALIHLAKACIGRIKLDYKQDSVRALALALAPGSEAERFLSGPLLPGFQGDAIQPLLCLTWLRREDWLALRVDQEWLADFHRRYLLAGRYGTDADRAAVQSWWVELVGLWEEEPAVREPPLHPEPDLEEDTTEVRVPTASREALLAAVQVVVDGVLGGEGAQAVRARLHSEVELSEVEVAALEEIGRVLGLEGYQG